MVKVFAENDRFRVEGTFDFGYIGTYKDDQIEIMQSYTKARNWDCVRQAIDTGSCTDNDIAAFLTYYINEQEKRIQQNIRQINNEFLYSIYDDMEACGREFWEREELTVEGFDYDDPDFDFYEIPEEATAAGFGNYMLGEANDGSVEKEDFETYLRKYRPMFNLDNFINGIVPESICFNNGKLYFQCSDKYDYALICGAYDEIDLNDLSFKDWHNY